MSIAGIIFLILFIIILAWHFSQEEGGNIWVLAGMFLLFSIIFFVIDRGNSSSTQTYITQYKDLPRKPFPEWVKQSTMQNQDGKCNMCGIPLNNYIAQYDHADNDKTNNQPSNCQALCANCHSEKTKMNR